MTDRHPRTFLRLATYFAARAQQYEERAKTSPKGSVERADALLIARFMRRKAERRLLREGRGHITSAFD